MANIPDSIRINPISAQLDELRRKYAQLSRVGKIFGLIVADQDAKVLAANSFFHTKLNYWDVGAIGAALYGVGKQARDFFHADQLDRGSLIFGDLLFFTHNIGTLKISDNQTRELILICIGERSINLGLIIMLMQKFAPKLMRRIEHSSKARTALQMSEAEFTLHLDELKKQLLTLSEGD